jgi:hypothetical protein
MRGRARGDQERIIALAYQTEVFARTKALKPLDKYLTPTKRTPKGGSSEVLAMLRRAKAKQDATESKEDGRGAG